MRTDHSFELRLTLNSRKEKLFARPIRFNLVQNATKLYDEIRGVREHDEEKLVQLVVLVFRKMGLVDSFKIDPQVPATLMSIQFIVESLSAVAHHRISKTVAELWNLIWLLDWPINLEDQFVILTSMLWTRC